MNYYDSKAISASDMKYLVNGWEAFLEYKNAPKKESKSMSLGTKIHSYLLENGKELKKYKAFKPVFDDITKDKQVEVEIYKEMFGIQCRSKIDILGDNTIIDLKTIYNINEIDNSIINYDYRLQLAFYELMANVSNSTLIFIETAKIPSDLLIPRHQKVELKELWREKEFIEEQIELNYKNIIKYQKGKL